MSTTPTSLHPTASCTDAPTDRTRAIVVGIDGSATSQRALTWALAEGAARGIPVTVLHAWSTLTAGDGMTCPSEESAEQFLHNRIAEAATDLPVLPAMVTMVTAGSAARTLVDLSSGACMLVLGQSRRAAATGILAGSVGAICARRAHCPVVIVNDRGAPTVYSPVDHGRPTTLAG
jgi:nucleotide-binding universal stress UspA family protein